MVYTSGSIDVTVDLVGLTYLVCMTYPVGPYVAWRRASGLAKMVCTEGPDGGTKMAQDKYVPGPICPIY